MNRQKKIYQITIHGVRGQGATRAAAKQDALKTLEAATEGAYTPWYFTADGHTLIVWRELLSGWCYKVIGPDAPMMGPLQSSVYMDGGFEQVRHSALFGLAQQLYK